MKKRRERPARRPVRTRPAIVVIAGGAEGEFTARLLRRLLESRPRTRVSVITPEQGDVPAALASPEHARCTHAILPVNGETMHACAGLHPDVVALTAPVQGAQELVSAADVAVLDLDERVLRERYAAAGGRIFTYSERRQEADLTARELRLFPGHMEFEAVIVGQIRRIHLPVPGGFALYHCLCALSCGLCLGLGLEEMARALQSVRGPRGLPEVLPIPAAYTVAPDRADEREPVRACVRRHSRL